MKPTPVALLFLLLLGCRSMMAETSDRASNPSATPAWEARLEQSQRIVDDLNAKTEAALRDQRERAQRDRPQREAERIRQNGLFPAYGACLFPSATRLALASTETSDIVAIAAFGSCKSHELKIAEAIGWEATDIMKARLKQDLITAIVQARDRRANPPQPAPTDRNPLKTSPAVRADPANEAGRRDGPALVGNVTPRA